MALRQSRTANCGLVLAGAGSARLCGEAAIAFDVDNSHSRPGAVVGAGSSEFPIAVIRRRAEISKL
jgi:hypothetical protein